MSPAACPSRRPIEEIPEELPLCERPDAGLFLETNGQAMLAPGQDDSWRLSESIESLRKFSAKYCRNMERVSGRVKECTHYDEVASYAIYFGQHLGLPDEVIAFIARAHDLCEDFPDEITPELIVKSCWKGEPSYAAYITNCIALLTDPHELRPDNKTYKKLPPQQKLQIKIERLKTQIKVSNDEETGLVALIRACDKYCTLKRDRLELLRGNMPFDGDEEAFREYYELRLDVVRSLKAPQDAKDQFSSLIDEIEDTLSDRDENEKRRTLLGDKMPARSWAGIYIPFKRFRQQASALTAYAPDKTVYAGLWKIEGAQARPNRRGLSLNNEKWEKIILCALRSMASLALKM